MIDIVFSSCARVELLARTVRSFNEKLVCAGEHREILVEDWVVDEGRREESREWIHAHRNLFSNVVFLGEQAGPYLQFQKAAEQADGEYLFKVDDDAEFLVPIEIDKMIEVMEDDPQLSELILRRHPHCEVNPRRVEIAGYPVTITDFFSISFGLYRMSHIRRLFDDIGWDEEAHESSVLTPAAKRLGLKCGIFGDGEVHYRHVGGELGYDKGAWK